MTRWAPLLSGAERLVQVTLERAESALADGELEISLQWLQVLSGFLASGGTFGRLTLAASERVAIDVASRVPALREPGPASRRSGPPRRVLHVLTEAFALFGHTRLARMWIELDAGARTQHVVLLDPFGSPPQALRQAVSAAGGDFHLLHRTEPLLTRAVRLRRLALECADLVLLHVHPSDVIPSVAFAAPGGPPVAYVNHADHEHWLGARIADRVIDTRPSAQAWTRLYRGIDRTTLLPLPLGDQGTQLAGREPASRLRELTRARLGIEPGTCLLLTIGSAGKYRPVAGLSFFDAAASILEQCPEARLLAVGPSPDADWRRLAQRTGQRVMAVGTQSDLAPFHAAADLYLEGMPAGSLTAMLEACLSGLCCVRAPARSRPPHASDGPVFEDCPQPRDVQAYVDEVLSLVRDGDRRRHRASRLQERARSLHCAPGWNRQLETVLAAIPPDHRAYGPVHPGRLPAAEIDIKLDYLYGTAPDAVTAMLAAYLEQLVQHSAVARRVFETALPRLLAEAGDSSVDVYQLLSQAVPELADDARRWRAPSTFRTMDATILARWLLRRMAESGRRGAALWLTLRLGSRLPGLWQPKDLVKGGLTLLAGRRAAPARDSA